MKYIIFFKVQDVEHNFSCKTYSNQEHIFNEDGDTYTSKPSKEITSFLNYYYNLHTTQRLQLNFENRRGLEKAVFREIFLPYFSLWVRLNFRRTYLLVLPIVQTEPNGIGWFLVWVLTMLRKWRSKLRKSISFCFLRQLSVIHL